MIHSFWVPEFGQKQDAVPGITTRLVITPDKVGSYPVICTELCGLGHSVMRSQAMVMTKGRFEAWLNEQGAATGSGNAGEAGTAVFENQGCGSCHTFKPAGSTGDRRVPTSTTSPRPPRRRVNRSPTSSVSRSSTRARTWRPASPTT